MPGSELDRGIAMSQTLMSKRAGIYLREEGWLGREAPPETGRGSQEDDLERRGGEKIFSRALRRPRVAWPMALFEALSILESENNARIGLHKS